jgi:medium-chain acyl-[acyl-carrier-protein] hydrolase
MRLQTSAFSDLPASAYTTTLTVRSYETTTAGMVAPATLLRYLEHIATLDSAARGFSHAWYETHGSAWVVRDMRLLLWNAPALADEVHLATWLSGYRRVQATREYCVWHEPEQRLVARAQGRWAYVDRARGLPARIPDELIERFGFAGHAMPLRPTNPAMSAQGEVGSEITLFARSYEADTQQHINNTIYLDWLGEALTRALTEADSATDMSPITPRYYHIQYFHPARPGDRMVISTQVDRTGSRRLTAAQTIRDDATGQIAVECRSEHLLYGSQS